MKGNPNPLILKIPHIQTEKQTPTSDPPIPWTTTFSTSPAPTAGPLIGSGKTYPKTVGSTSWTKWEQSVYYCRSPLCAEHGTEQASLLVSGNASFSRRRLKKVQSFIPGAFPFLLPTTTMIVLVSIT